MIRGLLVWLLASILLWTAHAGCAAGIRVTLTGRKHPPRPANCEIRFETMDVDQAAAQYEQIGLLTLDERRAGLSEGLKAELRPLACQMGGELVVPMTDVHSWVEPETSFLVLTSRTNKEP